MRPRRLFFFASAVAAIAACGSRTGLLVPPQEVDASIDSPVEAGVDATEEDAFEEDALPPIDVVIPPDNFVNDCPDAGSTLIYVISQDNKLFSFYPPTSLFKNIGTIRCPAAPTANPFSMAVDRIGNAYIVFSDGELFRVSTATAACSATGFISGQGGFAPTFGMGFSTNVADGGDVLYVAGDSQPVSQLATIDVTNFQLNIIGAFNPPITAPELTGTGTGELFGFWDPSIQVSSSIVQIDKQTAQVTNSSTLAGVVQGNAWAFAFWGGDFYTFTAPQGSTVVTRYEPTTGNIKQVAATSEVIVGAGVSTCAPAR